MQPRLLEQIPRFGWTRKVLLDDVVIGDGGGASPVMTEPFRRPAGMFQAAVLLTVPNGASTATGEFGAVLEGSNTGDPNNSLEWFPIASLDVNNLFVGGLAGDQVKLLGAAIPSGTGISFNGSSGNINIGRFAYMRVRAEVFVATITALVAPTSAAATITINGFTLTPAGGPRTPGNDDYDNTLGAPGLIAAEIEAALNDVANSFRQFILASVSGAVVTVRNLIGFSDAFTIQSGSPFELDVGPTFDMTVRMTGTAGDGEAFVKTQRVTSIAGEPVNKVSGVFQRAAGTRYITATAKLVDAIWDPPNANGYAVRIQGAFDKESADAGSFVNIGTEFLSEGGFPPPPIGITALFNPTAGLVIDMGPFNFFRFQVEATGAFPPTDLSVYTIDFTASFDDNDWVDGEQGLAALSSTLQNQFIQVRWGTPRPQVGTTVTVAGQFVDLNGVPVQPGTLRRAFIILSDDFFDKENNLHPTATLNSAFKIGSVANTSQILVGSTTGEFTVVVDRNAVPTTAYLSAIPYTDSPQSTLSPYMLISSEIETIVLT